MGAKRLGARACRETPSLQSTGSNLVGYTRAAKNRPHRLPVANPSLCRSRCAVPIRRVFWSHRGEACTFNVMVDEFGLASRALLRLATIVRGADTARLDLAPEAPGLLAASLGLSRMYADDSNSSKPG